MKDLTKRIEEIMEENTTVDWNWNGEEEYKVTEVNAKGITQSLTTLFKEYAESLIPESDIDPKDPHYNDGWNDVVSFMQEAVKGKKKLSKKIETNC
jgi:hypothetical protein